MEDDFQTTRTVTVGAVASAFNALLECSRQGVDVAQAVQIMRTFKWVRDRNEKFEAKRLELAKSLGSRVETKSKDSAGPQMEQYAIPPEKMAEYRTALAPILATELKIPEELMLTLDSLKNVKISANALELIAPFVRNL